MIPRPEKHTESIFTTKNFAITMLSLVIVFLLVILCHACLKKSGTISDDSEDYVSHDSLSSSYYYDSAEYTNSAYLRSDDQNSFIDH